MASSSYESTPETTNSNRVNRVVLGPCTDGLRDVLRHNVPPSTFPHVIKQKKVNLPRLTKDQQDLILPQHGSYTGSYDDMDISLLYILLRNISGIPPHSNGWSNDPDPSDRSLSANIERVRLIRNKCYGHSIGASMSNTEFQSIWSAIRSVMIDVDTFLNNENKYQMAVDFLRSESMDPEVRKQVEEGKTTREMVVSLESKLVKLTESRVPSNVREIHDMDIQKWRVGDKLYCETHSFPSVMEKVRSQPYITFVGVPWSGKSATAHHIALKLQEEGYEIVPTKDVRKMEDYGDARNPQVFVIDDVVGVFGLQETEFKVLIDYEQKITQPCMVKSKTLMTCREAVFNETLPYKPFFTKEETVICLHSSNHELDDNDKKQILQKYGLNEDLMSSELLKSTSRMFPLLSKLFSKETKFQALGSKFFQNPVQCIIDELYDMQRYNKLNYATLVLCMLNENSLSKDILKDRTNEYFMNVKSASLENCELESHTDAFKFVKALSAMEGTYTKQSGARYTFIHDSMFEICAYHYGQQFPDQMLLHMSSSYIANYVKPQTSESAIAHKVREKQSNSQSGKGGEGGNKSDRKKESDDKRNERDESFDLCIRLRENQYPLLAERLYRDIQNMELYDVFRNQVLKHPQVCQAFIGVLKTKSYTELKSLFLSSHEDVEKIVSKGKREMEKSEKMREEGERRRELMKEWKRQGALVDKRLKRDGKGKGIGYTYNMRVISWVIYYGHYPIFEYIIQQIKPNERSELFEITGNPPHQSKSWDFKTIKNMIISPSGISTCNKQESKNNRLVEQCRLLLLSCYSGDVQTVGVLLLVCKKTINEIVQINKDIDWCIHTPLVSVCMEGHVSLVKELVKAGADVNPQCTCIWRNTPLTAACKGGHASVVKKLLKARAAVNLQDDYGNTPLTAACKGGHVSVVEELVKAGADVNLWDNYGNTPLTAACKGGHVRVVEELVKVEANVNLPDRWGNTPLIAAIRECSLSTVKCLLEHRAYLETQVINFNKSAVYRALILNKADIVKYLIHAVNKINPGKFTGNVHLFNCLVDIRHARVQTDSRDDVVTDRSVGCMYRSGDVWRTIREGDCDVLRHLLCVGLNVNQSIQEDDESNVRPMLYTLIYEQCVEHRTEKVSVLLGSGADVNVRVRDRDYNSVLNRKGVSVLEKTRRLVCKYSESILWEDELKEFKEVMCEIKKHVRRHSV